jgi:hypothetical protein
MGQAGAWRALREYGSDPVAGGSQRLGQSCAARDRLNTALDYRRIIRGQHLSDAACDAVFENLSAVLQ